MLFGKDLTGIQNPIRIEGMFHSSHEGDFLRRQLQADVGRLREAHAVLAAERSFQGDDAPKQHALRLVRTADLLRIIRRDHDVDVDVAVADVAEARDPECEPGFQRLNEGEELGNSALWNDDIVIELERSNHPKGM